MKLYLTSVVAAIAVTLLLSFTVESVQLPSRKCRTATNIPVTALPYSANISMASYTHNATTTACDLFGRTLWWKFTPPTDGVLSVLTDDVRSSMGTSFVTRRFGPGLDLKTATFAESCDNIDEAVCGVNDFSAQSIAHPLVQAGVTYYIVVGETPRSIGNAKFNFTFDFEPFNLTVRGDECDDAIVVSQASLPFNDKVDTRLYTKAEGEAESTCADVFNSIFYRYTPTMNGLLIVGTSGSYDIANGVEYDSAITIYEGTCDNPVEVFCEDQNFAETAYFPVAAGISYTIKVGSAFIGYGGRLNITFSFQRNYFNLVDENEETTIGVLNDLYKGVFLGNAISPNTINYADPIFATTDLSIEAIFSKPSSIKSVRLQLDTQRPVCENNDDEFKLYGELNSKNIPFAIGNRNITATAYSRSNCRGNVLGRISQPFVVKSCKHLQYGLYDARRDVYLSNLYNGSSVANHPCQVSIGVTFACGFTPKRVRLELRRASNNTLVVKRDELSPPYLLFGNNEKGNIFPGRIRAGEYKITAIIDNIVHPSVTFNLGACAASPQVDKTFDIDLRFGDDNLFENTKLFPAVVERISSLIIGDRPDVTNVSALPSDIYCGEYPSRIDDLHICTSVGIFDGDGLVGGILGILVSTYSRPSDNLPVSATVVFDKVDFDFVKETGTIENFILQQLIITLGLGDYWAEFGLSTSKSSPCSYNGTKAKAEFMALTGCSSDIPLEQNSVPDINGYDFFDCLFWDPLCLKNEVLTFTLGEKKISRITLGALEDLGYVVNYTAADPYGPSDIGTCAGCNGNRNLKGQVTKSSPKKANSCYSGVVHERAVQHGRKMLRDVHDHHMEQTKTKPVPEGIVFTGNQRITVMYQHEDGTLCSVVVDADFLV